MIYLSRLREVLITIAFGLPCLSGTFAKADQTCASIPIQKQAEISAYVVKRNHLDPKGQLTLLESAPVGNTCYWRLRYRESLPKPTEMTYYLAPDGKYLLPSIFDLSLDPIAEERIAAANLMKSLVADEPPSIGSPNAPITIVEFSDFQCPFCKRLTDVLEKDLTADERKDIRIVFHSYPLSIHPWARNAAEVAGCAALQSDASFWKVHDYLFENQKVFTADNVREQATQYALSSASVDKAQFQKCLDRHLAVGTVTADVDLGNKTGVKVTPTMFINGTKYEGSRDATTLRSILADIRKDQQAQGRSLDPNVAVAK